MCWLVLLGPVVSVGGGGETGEGLVGPVGVVFGSPVLEHDLGFEDVGEVFGVEAFVSQASVEGLDVGVGQFHRSVHGSGHDDRCQYEHRPMEVPACQAYRWRCVSARRSSAL